MGKGRIGEYSCNPCGRKWYSCNFDHNSYQLCKSCEKTKCFPKIINYNTNNPPRHIQKVLKHRHMNQRRPHLSSYCQNCLEGKFCFSKENEAPKKQNVSPTNNIESNTLRVANISKDVTEKDLGILFSRFGAVSRISLPKVERYDADESKMVKEPRGFAYIAFEKHIEAEAALNALNGHVYKLEWGNPEKKL